ncbi:MAG TPA: helicase-related protein, partial [Clostridia bacterium]|nr:helicase-related protein [Clostridia bacterium]
QRAAISQKGSAPDTLIMSATPIPRTLSLLLYGDLDISVLDELPPGRKPVVTRVVPPGKREDMYRFIGERIRNGAQAFAVCPLVEPSEALEGVLGAQELYEELSKKLCCRVALIHGRLAGKEQVAEAFRRGEIDLLVATTVVEVGVDVPNASVMVVENAGRFGLAQLHQLRGRVGRGSQEAYCFLLSGADTGAARERLCVLASTNDGFEIARRDLELRGPGEFLGTRQHGMDGFAAARFASDLRAVNEAREAAELIVCAGGAGAEALVEKARKLLAEKENIVAKN